MKKRKQSIVLEDLPITQYAAEGKALAKLDGKVIFISGGVPGDVADVLITKSKKDWAEGRVLRIKQYSPDRETPFCEHFGVWTPPNSGLHMLQGFSCQSQVDGSPPTLLQ